MSGATPSVQQQQVQAIADAASSAAQVWLTDAITSVLTQLIQRLRADLLDRLHHLVLQWQQQGTPPPDADECLVVLLSSSVQQLDLQQAIRAATSLMSELQTLDLPDADA